LTGCFRKRSKGFYDYIVFYNDESLYDKVVEAVASVSLPVTMIATYPGENIVSVAYDLSLSTLGEFLAFQDRLVKGLTVPRVGGKQLPLVLNTQFSISIQATFSRSVAS